MKEKSPIKFKEHLQLKDAGINVSKVSSSNLTMQSDGYICVIESDDDKKRLVIIDLAESANPILMPTRADSVIMNPFDKILAMKVSLSGVIQVFDLERRHKMKNHTMNEDVVFWKWIASDMIALVTSKHVYHWNTKDDAPPLKIFDCSPHLSTCHPIDYRTDSQQKYSLVIGVLTKGDCVASGTMQMYSVEYRTTKILEGQVGTFAEIVLDGNKDSSILLCSASSTPKGIVLSVAQVNPTSSRDRPFRKKSVEVKFSIPNDTAIAMQESKEHKVLFVLSQRGFVHLYHLKTLDCLFKNRLSTDIVFATAPCVALDGVISVNSKGQVLSASVDGQYMVSFLDKKLAPSKEPSDTGVSHRNKVTANGKSRFFVASHNHGSVNDRFKASSSPSPLDNKVLHMLAWDGCKLEQKLDLKPLKQQISTSSDHQRAGWLSPQAVTNRNEKPNASEKPLENWLMHSTNTDSKEKRHFWKFQDNVITLSLSEGGSLIFKQIPLTSIAGVRLLKNGTRLSLKFVDSKIVMYVRGCDKERSYNILDRWCHDLQQALAFKERSKPLTGEPAVTPPTTDKKPGIFGGVQFVVHFDQHTMEAKKRLRHLVTVNGGQISYTLNKNTTFFVCDSDREIYRHQKAVKLGVPVVREKFLSDCVTAGKLIPAPQSEAVLRDIKDKFSRGAISIRDKFVKGRQKKQVEFSFEKLTKYKVDDAECPDFPEMYQVAKFSFLTDRESTVCVEAHVSDESCDSGERYRVTIGQKQTGDTKVRRSMYFVENLYDLTRCYESVIKSIENNDTKRCTDIMEITVDGVATEKLQNLLEEMKISKGSLNKKVQRLVGTLWEDSLGALAEYDVISKSITPHDVRNGLVALLKIEQAIESGKDCSKISAEFYTHVRRKSTGVIDSIQKVAKEREICQILKDVVCVKENLLNTADVRSFMLQYSALNCIIRYISPSEEEFKLVKDLLPGQNEVRHEIVNIYRVGRTVEDIEFRSGMQNKKLLFHSSSTSNFVSILSKGLIMPSKASAELGIPRTDEGKLGHGIYFSDSFQISSKYTNVSETRGTRLMLVSEIALGRIYDTEKCMYHLESSPEGFDSVRGKNLNEEMIGNEFVIYKENQQRMKYLVEFTLPGENVRTDHQLKELPIFKPTIDVPGVDSAESFQPSVKSVAYGLVSSEKNAVNLEEFHVRGKIVDLVAEVTVFQVYRNNLNSQIEGKYVFPLEENAAVCGFEAFINEKHVVGEVKEKTQARKEYRKAVSQGHGAYLMDEEEPNVFTLSLGNIPARARVIIKIKYVCELETVNDPDSCVLFALPKNLSDQKQELTLIDGTPTQSNTNSLKVGETAKKTSLMLSIDMPYDILDISSPTHGISYKKTLTKACVKLKSSASLLENKLRLLVKVAEIHVPRIWVERIEDETTADKIEDGSSNEVAMVTFFPEFDFDACDDYRCTILVDMSSSMAGKIGNHAKHIADNLIESLPETTKFNVVLFGSYFKEVFVMFENACDGMKQKAKDMINTCKPNLGGSDLVHVLASMSLLIDSSDQMSLRNVFLISDGHLSEETRTLRLASRISDATSSQTRFFTFAVGESPNAHFLRSMSDLTGGKYEHFLPSVKHTWAGQIENQLRFAQQPVLTNVHIDWCNYDTDALGKSFVNVPEKPKCVFSGSRLTAFSFVPNCSKATLHARIMGNEISTVVTVSSQSKVTGRTLHYLASKAIFKEYAAANLADSSLVDEIYRDERKSYIISLSVRNSVVCKFTSFIAVEKRNPGEDMVVVTGPTVDELLKSCFVDEISEVPWQELDSELSLRDKIKDMLKLVEQMESCSILRARELVQSALSLCENEKDPLTKVLVSATSLRLGVTIEGVNADAILRETLVNFHNPNFEVLHEMSKCESLSYSKAVEDLVSHSWSDENRMRLQSIPLLYRPAVVAAFLVMRKDPQYWEGQFWNHVNGIDMEKGYRDVVREVTSKKWQLDLLRIRRRTAYISKEVDISFQYNSLSRVGSFANRCAVPRKPLEILKARDDKDEGILKKDSSVLLESQHLFPNPDQSNISESSYPSRDGQAASSRMRSRHAIAIRARQSLPVRRKKSELSMANFSSDKGIQYQNMSVAPELYQQSQQSQRSSILGTNYSNFGNPSTLYRNQSELTCMLPSRNTMEGKEDDVDRIRRHVRFEFDPYDAPNNEFSAKASIAMHDQQRQFTGFAESREREISNIGIVPSNRHLASSYSRRPMSAAGYGAKFSGGSDVNSGSEESMASVQQSLQRATVIGGGALQSPTLLRKMETPVAFGAAAVPQHFAGPLCFQPFADHASNLRSTPEMSQSIQFANLPGKTEYGAQLRKRSPIITDKEDVAVEKSRCAAMGESGPPGTDADLVKSTRGAIMKPLRAMIGVKHARNTAATGIPGPNLVASVNMHADASGPRASLNRDQESEDVLLYALSDSIELEQIMPPVDRKPSKQPHIRGRSSVPVPRADFHSTLSMSPPVKTDDLADLLRSNPALPASVPGRRGDVDCLVSENHSSIPTASFPAYASLATTISCQLASSNRDAESDELGFALSYSNASDQSPSSDTDEKSGGETSSASSDSVATPFRGRSMKPDVYVDTCSFNYASDSIYEEMSYISTSSSCADSDSDESSDTDDFLADAPVRSPVTARLPVPENAPGRSRQAGGENEDFDSCLARLALKLLKLSDGSENYIEKLAEEAAENIVIASGGRSLDPTSFIQAKKMLCQSALILLYEAYVQSGKKVFQDLVDRLKIERKLADAKCPMMYDRLELGSSWEVAARKVIVAIDFATRALP